MARRVTRKVGNSDGTQKEFQYDLPETAAEWAALGYGGTLVQVPSDVVEEAHKPLIIDVQSHIRPDVAKASSKELTARAKAYRKNGSGGLTVLDYTDLTSRGMDDEAIAVLAETDGVFIIHRPQEEQQDEDTETETEGAA